MLGLDSGFASCRKELRQPFVLEAADHLNRCNLMGYGLQDGLTPLIQVDRSKQKFLAAGGGDTILRDYLDVDLGKSSRIAKSDAMAIDKTIPSRDGSRERIRFHSVGRAECCHSVDIISRARVLSIEDVR